MKERYLVFLAIGLAFSSGSFRVASGQTERSELLPLSRALGRDFWSSPRFIKSFVGDYGFRTAIEPRVERKEQELLRKVVSQAQNDHPAAITTLEEKISIDSSAALDFTLATLRFQNSQLTRAAEGYRAAIEKFPGFLRSHKNLGLVLLQLGDYQNAAEALLKSISLGENEGVSFVALGFCYLNLEKFASAENAYRAAILRNPDGENAHNGLVNCLLETDRHEEAVAMLDELIQKQPDQPFYWRAQTNAYVELGKTREAAVNLET
ncbi:MAG: tetratricopeptide repeat protein, partial [Opitutales bacterium]